MNCPSCAGTDRNHSEFCPKRISDELAASAGSALAARVLAMCKKRGWSLHWTARGAYLHLESSELIEALRGKHGDPLSEAADVLIVLMSITENHGLRWDDVMDQVERTVEKLETRDHYKGEEFTQNSDYPTAVR